MPKNQNNRGGNRGRRSKNNNPEGHNQYSNGWMDMARERPATAAVAAAAAVGAGVFLWSRRDQISEQLTQLSDQIGEWTENFSSEREFEMAGGDTSFVGSSASGTSGEFGTSGTSGTSGSAIGGAGTTRKTAARSARPTGSTRRSASSATGTGSGSGTMSGGSLDTGPSGRGRE